MANKTAGVNPDYFGEPMTNDTYMIGANLLKTGTLVSFRIVEEEVLPAHDEAEFGMRVLQNLSQKRARTTKTRTT
jgi:hypothetical protein